MILFKIWQNSHSFAALHNCSFYISSKIAIHMGVRINNNQTFVSVCFLSKLYEIRLFDSNTPWRLQKFCSSCLTTVRPLSNMLVSRLGVTDCNHFDFHSIFSDFADLWYSGLVGNFKSCKHWEKIVSKNAISNNVFFNPVKNFETFPGNFVWTLLTFSLFYGVSRYHENKSFIIWAKFDNFCLFTFQIVLTHRIGGLKNQKKTSEN